MEHYIKIDKRRIEFDPVTNRLSFAVWFDKGDGSTNAETFPQTQTGGYYKDLKFCKIYIGNQDYFDCVSDADPLHVIELTPANPEGTIFENQQFDFIWNKGSGNQKIVRSVRDYWEVNICLDDYIASATKTWKSNNVCDNLFFVWVCVEGEYNSTEPYIKNQDKQVMFAFYFEKSLYNEVYHSLKNSINVECCSDMNTDVANKIIWINGLESSLYCGKWKDAVKFWNLVHEKNATFKTNCNCK